MCTSHGRLMQQAGHRRGQLAPACAAQKGCLLHFHCSMLLRSGPHASALKRGSFNSARAAPRFTRARSSSRLSPVGPSQRDSRSILLSPSSSRRITTGHGTCTQLLAHCCLAQLCGEQVLCVCQQVCRLCLLPEPVLHALTE